MSQQSLSCWLKKSSTSSDIIKESQGCSNAPESIDVSINKLASTTSTQPVTDKNALEEISTPYCEDKNNDDAEILGEKTCNVSSKLSTPLGPKDLSQLPTDSPSQPLMRKYRAHMIGQKVVR